MKKVSDPILLDVNVLVALAWRNHPKHATVNARMNSHSGSWLTCVVTQLGFVRLSSNSAVTKQIFSPLQAAEFLRRLTSDPMHLYIDSPSILSARRNLALERAIGHQQVTDAYLLSLAASHGARFLTLDTRLTDLAED